VSQRTTTRRTALQTALTAALAAGGASLLPTTTSAAPAATTAQQATVIVVNYADLTAACARLEAECFRTLDIAAELSKRQAALGLTDEQRRVIDAHEEALFDHHQVTMDWYVAELARHFPGLAPAFTAVWEHVRDSSSAEACCERKGGA
jgi:hypothetical protein